MVCCVTVWLRLSACSVREQTCANPEEIIDPEQAMMKERRGRELPMYLVAALMLI